MANKDFVIKNGVVANGTLIYAPGGGANVGINTNNVTSATLTVNGTLLVYNNIVVGNGSVNTSYGPSGINLSTIVTSNLTITGTIYDQANIATQTLVSGANVSWNIANGIIATLTLTSNVYFNTPTSMKVGTVIVHCIQDGTGSRTGTFNPAVFKFSGGVPPTFTTTPNAHDIFSGICDGTFIYGTFIPDAK